MNEYYFRLGISPGETAATIRQVFRQQVKLYHPERLGDRLPFFQHLVRCYHALSNLERRECDGAPSFVKTTETTGNGNALPGGLVEEGFRGLPQLSPPLPVRAIFSPSIFEAALARASRNLIIGTIDPGTSPQALDLQVVISPFEALAGGVLVLAVPSCAPCSGCGGAGKRGRFPCELCDGEGLLRQSEAVRFGVQANAGDVTQIKVPLRGLGPHNFYLSVRVRVAAPLEESESEVGS